MPRLFLRSHLFYIATAKILHENAALLVNPICGCVTVSKLVCIPPRPSHSVCPTTRSRTSSASIGRIHCSNLIIFELVEDISTGSDSDYSR